MAHLDRRDFLRAGITAGAGLGVSLLRPQPLAASPQPLALSIAHYKSSPADPDGITE